MGHPGHAGFTTVATFAITVGDLPGVVTTGAEVAGVLVRVAASDEAMLLIILLAKGTTAPAATPVATGRALKIEDAISDAAGLGRPTGGMPAEGKATQTGSNFLNCSARYVPSERASNMR